MSATTTTGFIGIDACLPIDRFTFPFFLTLNDVLIGRLRRTVQRMSAAGVGGGFGFLSALIADLFR
jgi:hypothetical protein